MFPDRHLEDLIHAFVAYTRDLEFTTHVGRYNRLYGRRETVVAALAEHAESDAGFAALLGHPDAKVRLATAWICRWRHIHADIVTKTLGELIFLPGDIGDSARTCLATKEFIRVSETSASHTAIPYAPQPAGCSLSQAEMLIRGRFADERADSISKLLLPSIRIWPRPASGILTESRFGGMPVAPPGWSWPFEDEEPLLFLGRIDCAQVRAVAHTALPAHGILSFFGDHDDVNGYGPTSGGKIYYFADIAGLRPVEPPLGDFEHLIECGLSFYSHTELPHPASHVVSALGLSTDESATYEDIARALTFLGMNKRRYAYEVSKLFGWPDLIQGDLDAVFQSGAGDAPPRLLVQIGEYHDGATWRSWGPGGLVYFTIRENHLIAGRLEAANLEMQCT